MITREFTAEEAYDRKLALCGWLQKNDPETYRDPVKLQYFLFLYEAFTKAAGEPADFSDLYAELDMMEDEN